MIDQNRVRQMSRLAMMESEIDKNATRVYTYRGEDFVVFHMLKGFFVGTVCFAALMVLWLGYIWDDLNLVFADAQFEAFMIETLKAYGIFMAGYLVLCAIVASVKYYRCAKQRKRYLKYLKALRKSYASGEEEE